MTGSKWVKCISCRNEVDPRQGQFKCPEMKNCRMSYIEIYKEYFGKFVDNCDVCHKCDAIILNTHMKDNHIPVEIV